MTMLGRKHSEEAKAKMQQSAKPWNKGKKMPLTAIEKNRAAHLGKKQSVETIEKRALKLRGQKRSVEICEKFKENHADASGSNNSNWKGGITPLTAKIRALQENKNWIKSVFVRDNYTCQDCGQVGRKLEAHHRKAFATLFQEFLQTYSQFSPIEDKETLVRLAMTWQPFWDTLNGETLCTVCRDKVSL